MVQVRAAHVARRPDTAPAPLEGNRKLDRRKVAAGSGSEQSRLDQSWTSSMSRGNSSCEQDAGNELCLCMLMIVG
eukprot:1158052-Pleurochrysis_carterae.AAC.1